MKGWKSGTVGLIGLAAIASRGLETPGSAHSPPNNGRSEIGCDYHDPLSPCAADFNLEHPIGDGLVMTLIEDFF